jgi:uncharacterized protein YukE
MRFVKFFMHGGLHMAASSGRDLDPLILELLQEYKENREALKVFLSDIEAIKDKVSSIFPERIDKRYKYLFEEKIKTATAFYNSLLDIRKEISRSLKDEMERRRRIAGAGLGDLEDLLNIVELADRVERVQMDKDAITDGQ